MIYFSKLITSEKYKPSADRLFTALEKCGIANKLIECTKDIWLRDFMPIKTKSSYVSFRYTPSYLSKYEQIQTNYKADLSEQFDLQNLIYSDINLDGGNVVFSPDKSKAIMSDRIFTENPSYDKEKLHRELETLLEARVIIIESLKSDMTGHADGMVRFVNENTVIGNKTNFKMGLEQRNAKRLVKAGFNVIDFPYIHANGKSAVGCYLNFLETEDIIFLPVFGSEDDSKAIEYATRIFNKQIVPVNTNEIANGGGALNCISWEA